ncbi:MAG: adenylate/guanylate cyclase domain-containing protein [Actinomycetota bacterium]
MRACPVCHEPNPDRARFCLRCGAALGTSGQAEERKVVTVLFAEAVGLAPDAGTDPETLKAALEPFHARCMTDVESFGGTIDKFIGNVVFAVFGAPMQHEDDPQRAVLAALKLQRSAAELQQQRPDVDLRLRIGVNTGEVVVAFGAGPQVGERVTGDAVNIASRLQTSAEPGEIVVGETTYRATRARFSYEDRDAVRVKGKAEPLARWRPVMPRARFGVDVRELATTPFVGRADERALLNGAYRRALLEPSAQLVTVIGEPGVGKSRLIDELSAYLDTVPELVRWRQGRCLPYGPQGEGVSFWALGEIVKSEAGILDDDSPAEAVVRLRAAVGAIGVAEQEADWLVPRLAPLAGLGEEQRSLPRSELFAAWRRYLEALAIDGPTVLVIEDLHWADASLLEFVNELVDWTAGVPLLLLCASRPELFDRHPGWGGGKRNSLTISLSPLTGAETSQLLSALLDERVLDPETHREILQQCGGNPLYAEEFVRMLSDRGLLTPDTTSGVGDAEVVVPPTIQGLIAARLDVLPPERKVLLHDAAVLGKVFWSGAVASMAVVPVASVEEAFVDLSRRELIRHARTSSVRDESEYAFWHELVQVVTYGQIPRRARAEKHRAAAAWLEQLADDRRSDLAEQLAYHYGEALSLADPGQVDPGLNERAALAFLLVGQRSRELDAARAERAISRALELLPPGHPSRAEVLAAAGQAATALGHLGEGVVRYREAIETYAEAGDILGRADTMVALARTMSLQEGSEQVLAVLDEAISLLEGQPPGRELVRAYAHYAGTLWVAGDEPATRAWADKGVTLAHDLELEDEAVLPLQYRGAARSAEGDAGGLDDLREAIRLGQAHGLSEETSIAHNNYAYELWFREGPRPALAEWTEMEAFAGPRGFTTRRIWATGGRVAALYDLGEWDEALELADDVAASSAGRDANIGVLVELYAARIRLARGEIDDAAGLIDDAVPRARRLELPEYEAPAHLAAAQLELARGDRTHASAHLRGFAAATEAQPGVRMIFLPDAVRSAIALDLLDAVEPMLEGGLERRAWRGDLVVRTARAAVREAQGRLEEAAAAFGEVAEGWDAYGVPPEVGHALLARARCFGALGLVSDRRIAVDGARAIVDRIGARPLTEALDRLG